MIEKHIIQQALDKYWNIGPAAKSLGIGYSTLRKYIKDHGIVHNSRKCRNGPKRLNYNSAYVVACRRAKRLQILEYRGGMKCTRCGFDEQIPSCYALHHRDPSQKDPAFGKMQPNNWSFERMKPELDKCDILCHNCHSIVHYEWEQLAD